MSGIWKESIGSLNRFIAEQQALGGEGTFSLTVFDDVYTRVMENVPLMEVKPIDATDPALLPRGMTALYDAIGRTLHEIFPQQVSPDTLTIVGIMTDGGENSSKEFRTLESVNAMVKHAEEEGFQVVFMGANLDVKHLAAQTGLNQTSSVAYAATAAGVTNVMNTYSGSVSSYRTGKSSEVIMNPVPDEEEAK
jgi:hypothetical protein